ncbi:MAG: carboxypeptidase-like regulatory domain-containing protein, partial [Gemmatimonadota bacterium]
RPRGGTPHFNPRFLMLHLLLSLSTLASAAPVREIFGDVRLGDRYLANAKLELTCGTETIKATTDSLGSFRFPGKTVGKCRLTVSYETQAPWIDVVGFDKPSRYRFVLELQDGKYTVKRV